MEEIEIFFVQISILIVIFYLLYWILVPKSVKRKILIWKLEDEYKNIKHWAEKEWENANNRNKKDIAIGHTKKGDIKNCSDFVKEIYGMRKLYIRNAEKYRHDSKILSEIIQDWSNYLGILSESKTNSEILDAGGDPSSDTLDEIFDGIDKDYIRIDEIIKRFKKLAK